VHKAYYACYGFAAGLQALIARGEQGRSLHGRAADGRARDLQSHAPRQAVAYDQARPRRGQGVDLVERDPILAGSQPSSGAARCSWRSRSTSSLSPERRRSAPPRQPCCDRCAVRRLGGRRRRRGPQPRPVTAVAGPFSGTANRFLGDSDLPKGGLLAPGIADHVDRKPGSTPRRVPM